MDYNNQGSVFTIKTMVTNITNRSCLPRTLEKQLVSTLENIQVESYTPPKYNSLLSNDSTNPGVTFIINRANVRNFFPGETQTTRKYSQRGLNLINFTHFYMFDPSEGLLVVDEMDVKQLYYKVDKTELVSNNAVRIYASIDFDFFLYGTNSSSNYIRADFIRLETDTPYINEITNLPNDMLYRKKYIDSFTGSDSLHSSNYICFRLIFGTDSSEFGNFQLTDFPRGPVSSTTGFSLVIFKELRGRQMGPYSERVFITKFVKAMCTRLILPVQSASNYGIIDDIWITPFKPTSGGIMTFDWIRDTTAAEFEMHNWDVMSTEFPIKKRISIPKLDDALNKPMFNNEIGVSYADVEERFLIKDLLGESIYGGLVDGKNECTIDFRIINSVSSLENAKLNITLMSGSEPIKTLAHVDLPQSQSLGKPWDVNRESFRGTVNVEAVGAVSKLISSFMSGLTGVEEGAAPFDPKNPFRTGSWKKAFIKSAVSLAVMAVKESAEILDRKNFAMQGTNPGSSVIHQKFFRIFQTEPVLQYWGPSAGTINTTANNRYKDNNIKDYYTRYYKINPVECYTVVNNVALNANNLCHPEGSYAKIKLVNLRWTENPVVNQYRFPIVFQNIQSELAKRLEAGVRFADP